MLCTVLHTLGPVKFEFEWALCNTRCSSPLFSFYLDPGILTELRYLVSCVLILSYLILKVIQDIFVLCYKKINIPCVVSPKMDCCCRLTFSASWAEVIEWSEWNSVCHLNSSKLIGQFFCNLIGWKASIVQTSIKNNYPFYKIKRSLFMPSDTPGFKPLTL